MEKDGIAGIRNCLWHLRKAGCRCISFFAQNLIFRVLDSIVRYDMYMLLHAHI